MSALRARRLWLPLLLVLLALIPFLAAKTPMPPGPSATQILEIHDGSLTTYLAGATPVQDVQPRVEQRGVNADGSMRASSTHPMHLNGNPYGSPWSKNQSLNGVMLASGAFAPLDVDIALPATGPSWVIGRTYNARQDNSGARDSDGYQGKNWFQTSQPEIEIYWDTAEGTKDADDVLYLVYGADRFLEFQRYSATSEEFKGVNGAAGMIDFVDGGDDPDLYVYVDQWGYEFSFFGFDDDAGTAAGQFWKVADPEGLESFAGDASLANDPITLGFDTGRITTAYDSENRRYTYTYTSLNGTNRLTEVKAETKTGGTWSSPTGLATVAEVDYEYYGDETYGDIGDLKMVIVTDYLSDSGVTVEKKKYFRYWEGTFNSSTNPGHPHALKYVYDFEGTRRYDWAGDSDFDEDFLTASNSTLETYSSAYFEYDSSHRIDKGFFGGACGCGGAANGTHELTYETNGSYTDNSGYDTAWSDRVKVERPDGSYSTQYFDEAAQSLHEVFTDGDPDVSYSNKWVTKITRSSDGIVTDISTPANITGYTHSTASITTSTSAGLVWTYVLETTGDTKGFLADTKYRTGTSGSAYYVKIQEYGTASLAKTDVTVVRPVIDLEKVFVNAVSGTPAAADFDKTNYTLSWYSGKLVLEEVLTKHPKVTTANLGSDARVEEKTYFTKQGRVDSRLRGSGVIDHTGYTAGRPTKNARDATTGDGVPSAWSALVSADAVRRVEEHTYDAQGRRATTEPPGETWERQQYYSKLADGRLITLSYPKVDTSGTTTYYGPASFTVTNHAGQTEASGTIGLSSTTTALASHIDETDSDPLLAIGIGLVDRLTVNVFNDAGQQQDESWLYFDIPTSGAGTEGTNYDASYFGYDDLGRQTRRKEPHGTINRTVYDEKGRRQRSLIGTNDSSYAGGEPSGTDDMVATEILEYDGDADDGNGHVTERTLRVEDSSTDERVTTYAHDVRGRVILVTNPTAPHILNKVDHRGRVIAVGRYSSSSGLDTSDDPTSLATNRMALSQTFYNERGQVWKTQRHEIDPADGSDDDNLRAKTWYDADGRVIKLNGEQLVKTAYDRLGRVTHRFTLASDNDSGYTDADDVTGDIVLLEAQTTYESSDSDGVVMSATISRHHDDYGGSETTGTLDTNADSDDLKYTAANLSGRIQITAMWHDDLGRVVDTVEYGNNDTDADGDSDDFDRDGLSAPTRSDTKLRTTFAYYDHGARKSVTDPRDLEARFEYDDAGRQTAVIRNYVNGVPSGTTGDDDVFTRTVYTDGLRTKYWVDFDGDNVEDTGDQVTSYTFGTTKGASAGDSEIGTGHLLQRTEYPDSTGESDAVTLAYNARSQEIYRKDQAGNVLEKDYDDSGRLEHDRATTVASGFDGDIKRITVGYDGLGRRETVSQYDNATVGSGTVQDEVEYTYDGWGNISKIEQDNDSAVGGSGVTDYEISYTYAKATSGRNTIRWKEITLPSGAGYEFDYSSTGSRHDAEASRVTSILEGISPAAQTTIVNYEYLGISELVGTEYPSEDIKRERFGSPSGIYDAFDNFDRVAEDKWVKDLATDISIYEVALMYDRNSNITLVNEIGPHVGFDVAYTMDGLDRLTDAQQGTWNGSSITSETSQQVWTLDQVGNWEDVTLDFNDDNAYAGTDEYDDDRVHNDVNELTSRDIDDDETVDYTLTYDAAGSLTDDGESYKYEYDVWSRLRKVKSQSDALVAEHRYNGLKYRIAEHTDTDDDGDADANDDWHHFAYDEQWRIVAMFVASDTAPTVEFLYDAAGDSGAGFASRIDDVALQDNDTDGNGSFDERVWYCQSLRSDMALIVDDSGDQREMVRYGSYGVPFGMPGADTDSDGDNDATDITQIQTWIDTSAFDVRADIDLDGDIDATDKSKGGSSPLSGATLGYRELSALRNPKGYAGHHSGGDRWTVRERWLDPHLGRWLTRDPAEYVDGSLLYAYVGGNPASRTDPTGLSSECLDKSFTITDLVKCDVEVKKLRLRGTCPAAWGQESFWEQLLCDISCPPTVLCPIACLYAPIAGWSVDEQGTKTIRKKVTWGGGLRPCRICVKIKYDIACDVLQGFCYFPLPPRQ